MKCWDASAIIPRCLEEPWTPWLTQGLAEDTLMIVWWGSMVECWSAFARLRREGLFQPSEDEHARALLAHLATVRHSELPLWERINAVIASHGAKWPVEAHYSKDIVGSADARLKWIEPDLVPLPD